MRDRDSICHLIKLARLDIDAAGVYTRSIRRVGSLAIRERLIEFRGDHERHIVELSALIRALGGRPPEHRRDLKGLILEAFTAVWSAAGSERSLKAIRADERIINRIYESTLALELPSGARDLVRRSREQERRHLEYIEDVIATRRWEEVEREAQPPVPPL